MRAAAIIPAYNEEKTIGEVVATLVGSKAFGEIVVVSDGSKDGTARVAREAGATLVHEMPWKHGKGAAMGHGVIHTNAEVVCFFDADLKGLTTAHVAAILGPVVNGERYMNVGLRDKGPVLTGIAAHLPLVGGERALRREIFEAIPEKYLHGFKVESALNYFCRINGLPYGIAVLSGLTMVRKFTKVGFFKSIGQYARMWYQVIVAMIQVRLARREFRERGTHMSHKH
jgi:hypothetical protein